MTYVIVDVEADGPVPAEYSMVCFGAVIFDERLDQSFYGTVRPISERFVPGALAVSGISREQHLCFEDPKPVMEGFGQFINYYFHRFLGHNPFGFSGRRIGDLYAGLVKDASKATEWKKYRVTEHTHNPVDDARGNGEALKKFRELGLKI
jgi:DNA polymerase III epsilon subunit-like protein